MVLQWIVSAGFIVIFIIYFFALCELLSQYSSVLNKRVDLLIKLQLKTPGLNCLFHLYLTQLVY